MSFEDDAQKDLANDVIQPEIDQAPKSPSANLSKEEPSSGYLSFTDAEKAKVVRSITEEAASKGLRVEGKQIDFPAEQEEIESLINSYPQHFETKRLMEVALNHSEYAPNLTREIANRKDYSRLEQILKHYKKAPNFEYCVREIETSLKSDEMQDSVLMALSEAIAKSEELEEPKTIAKHEDTMIQVKKTARSIDEYQRLLKISDDELQGLHGKELLLVGGGFSPIKRELRSKGIECTVTNIDPIAKPNPETADTVIKGDFYETEIAEDKFDQVMALHSLPTYAFTPEQVRNFYCRSILSLKKGGILSITPIAKFSDAFTPAMRLSRKPVSNASAEFVERLESRPDLFVVTRFLVEYEKPFGRKAETPGVKIEVIGNRDQIKKFLTL